MNSKNRNRCLTWLGGITLLLAGCTSTYDIYQSPHQKNPIVLREGMTQDEVVSLLGEPKVRESQPGSQVNWFYHFRTAKKLYIIRIHQGRVLWVEERFQEEKN